MALPILDGNQTATTLSSVVTGGEHIVAHSVVSLGPTAISNITSAVSGIPISGTVTANVSAVGNAGETIPDGALVIGLEVGGTLERVSNNVPLPVTAVGAVTIGSLPAISGAVTANVSSIFGVTDQAQFAYNFGDNFADGVLNFGSLAVSQQGPISGTVTVSSLPASTVTVSALPSGALTTRFGSVVTANLAAITSAVTNTSRKYLLAQNISAGTVTIGIGFSPTTTQGIQLAAGGGLTFDAFCPTGAVYWLGAVTGAAYTILEG